MMAVAPNLTILVGELVGARLISHAGSLLNLAKHPASTVQILGAEKALFRALKAKHDTPKYGLIYHAQLVSSANAKFKGKMSRMLAAKAALAIRVDALGEESTNDLGVQNRGKLESRLKNLEEGTVRQISGSAKQFSKANKFNQSNNFETYNQYADTTKKSNKRKIFDDGDLPDTEAKLEEDNLPEEEVSEEPVKKKKKDKKNATNA